MLEGYPHFHLTRHNTLQKENCELLHFIIYERLSENTALYKDASKEKHSLTRKLVGYRNWRQKWCKKEGNKVLGKG